MARTNICLSETELQNVRIQEAKLRAEEIRKKNAKVQARSASVPSYHGSYFSKGSLLKKGYLDYNKR